MNRSHESHLDEGGFTLIEVGITTAILLVVLAILAPLLTGALTSFGRQSDRSAALDQAQLVMQQIEHDVLSASTINVVSPGNDLQLITGPASSATCIEYAVPTATAPQPLALQRRSRASGTGVAWPAWRTLLTALSIKGQPAGTVIPNTAGANPFVANPVTSTTALGSINVNIQVQNGGSPVVQLTTTMTGETALVTGPSGTAAWTANCS